MLGLGKSSTSNLRAVRLSAIGPLVALVVYLVVFPSQLLGNATGSLISAPIVFAAWTYGARVAVVVALIAFGLNSLLETQIADREWGAWIQAGGGMGHLILGVVAAFVGWASDLTRRLRRAEGSLRSVHRQTLNAQEVERNRIARELHDEFAQELTALRFLLERIGKASLDERPRVAEGINLVDSLIERSRDLSMSLRPMMLDDIGLLPALGELAHRYTERTGVSANIQHNGIGDRFPQEIETAVYRIVQEGLTNVARHAKADEVSINLSSSGGSLTVLIEDRGVGFDWDAASAVGTHAGLQGISERAGLLGGRFTVDSSPGRGTRLEVVLPQTGAKTRGAPSQQT